MSTDEPTTLGWYVLPGHPWGASTAPCFEVVGAFVYPAAGHPAGPSSRPWFQIRDGCAYAVDAHPDGASTDPSLLVSDGCVYPVEVTVESGTGTAHRVAVPRGGVGGALTGEHRRPGDQHRAEARADDRHGDATERHARESGAPVGAHHHQRGTQFLGDVVDRIRRTVRAHDVRADIRSEDGPGRVGRGGGRVGDGHIEGVEHLHDLDRDAQGAGPHDAGASAVAAASDPS